MNLPVWWCCISKPCSSRKKRMFRYPLAGGREVAHQILMIPNTNEPNDAPWHQILLRFGTHMSVPANSSCGECRVTFAQRTMACSSIVHQSPKKRWQSEIAAPLSASAPRAFAIAVFWAHNLPVARINAEAGLSCRRGIAPQEHYGRGPA